MPDEKYSEQFLLKVAKGAGIVFIGTAVGMLLAYISMLIIARFLGPEDYGLISLASAVTTIASTVVLVGMAEGVTRYVSFYKGRGEKEKIKGVILSSLEIVLPLAVTAAVLVFLFADEISVKFFSEPNLASVLRVFAVSIPFFPLLRIFNRAIAGFQEIKYAVYSEHILQNLSRLLLLIFLLYMGLGIIGAAYAYVIGMIVAASASFYFLNKIFPTKGLKTAPLRRELISFSWPLMFSGMLGLVMGWIDTLMLGYFMTARDVGIYRASLAIANLLKVFPASFMSIFLPIITEMYSRGEVEKMNEINCAVTKWILMLVLPITILMILFSKQVLYILYGEEYIEGAFALCILVVGRLIISIFRPTSQIIYTVGRTKLVMMNTCIGSALNVLLNFYLIPAYGINGAAIATSVSILTVNSLAFAEIFKIIHIQPLKFSYIKIFLASLISIYMTYVITKYLLKVTMIYILIAMFLFYLSVYFALLLILRSFESEDIVVMKAIEMKTGVESEWIRKVIKKFL